MGHDTPTSGDSRIPYEVYEALDVPLGDLLRGERATAGKSLLDVERDLRIRASYISAIENADVAAFSSPGFIAGYVRSYARYLGLDPEWTYRRFCDEAGFHGVHGLSARQAVAAKRDVGEAPGKIDPNDVISAARVSFAPARERVLDRIEPGALGSVLVLAALAVAIGFGAWAVLNDIQRVSFAPVDETPETFAEFDPVAGVPGLPEIDDGSEIGAGGLASSEGFDRIYRPQALDAPVLTPRDQPLASLDPDTVGTLAAPRPSQDDRATPQPVPRPGAAVQVTERVEDEVLLFAVRPSWVRVTSASGVVIFEQTLEPGDSFEIPNGEVPPTLRTGNPGALYFAVNGVTMGPVGEGATIVDGVILSADAISESYVMADATSDPDLPEVAALVLSATEEAE